MAEYTEIGKKEKMAGHTEIIDIGVYYEVNSTNNAYRPIYTFFFKNGQKRRLRPISCIDLSPVNYGTFFPHLLLKLYICMYWYLLEPVHM